MLSNKELKSKTPEIDVINFYQLSANQFKILLVAVEHYLKDNGVNIYEANLETSIEFESLVPKGIKLHHETAISDGKSIYVRRNMNDAGGCLGRVYDLLHLGLGHYTQWNITEPCDEIEFQGDLSWAIATTPYMGASKGDLELVYRYEFEAANIYLRHLDCILEDLGITNEVKQRFVGFYNDYSNTDLEYILMFYKEWYKQPADQLPSICDCW